MSTLKVVAVTTGFNDPVIIEDIGFVELNHPSSTNLLDFCSISELSDSADIQALIDSGDLEVFDENRNPILDIKSINNVGNIPVQSVTFPSALVRGVFIEDSTDLENYVLRVEGDWLTPETTAEIVSPTGIVFKSWRYSSLNLGFATFDVSGIGTGDLDLRVINYGKETLVTELSARVLALDNFTGEEIEIDLRQGGSELALRESNTGDGTVAVYSTNNVVINRDSFVGAQYPGLTNSRTWFRFLNISGNLEGGGTRLEKLEFIVYYGGGRFYLGIANDEEMNASGSRNEVESISIGVEFRSNDLRSIVGIENGDDDFEINSQNFDLNVGNYFRVEFDFVGDNTVRLYQLASGDKSSWYEELTPIFSQSNNYLNQFEQGDGPYYPVLHWIDGSTNHGLLAIRGCVN